MLELLKISSMAIVGIGLLFIIGFSFFSGRFFKHILLNSALGIASFFAVKLTAVFTGVTVAFNGWTFLSALIYGIPAVLGNLLLNLLFSL